MESLIRTGGHQCLAKWSMTRPLHRCLSIWPLNIVIRRTLFANSVYSKMDHISRISFSTFSFYSLSCFFFCFIAASCSCLTRFSNQFPIDWNRSWADSRLSPTVTQIKQEAQGDTVNIFRWKEKKEKEKDWEIWSLRFQPKSVETDFKDYHTFLDL